jgi:hypothetical protein
MKKISMPFACTAVLALALFLAGCGDEPLTKKEEVIKKLTAKSWSIQSVTIDDADNTSEFSGLKLTFTKTGFTAENENIIWPSSGTWNFTDATASAFIRNDDLEVSITEITDSKLVVTLQWADTYFGEGGRTKALQGEYVFVFN